MVKGILFKYQAMTNDDFLQDGGHISDPDFFSITNPNGTIMPMWAVCAVNERARLNEGDIVFFLPMKDRYTEKLKPYAFTGVLVCKEKNDEFFVKTDNRLTEEYIENYTTDLANHRNGNFQLRSKNVIYGMDAPKISRWFGNRPVPAQKLLKELDLSEQLEKIGMRRIPDIKDEEKVRQLYDTLMSRTKPTEVTKPSSKKEKCLSCLNE